MKYSLIAGILLIGVASWTLVRNPEKDVKVATQPVVVLELFTSQGCSSCPPADRALQEITQRAASTGQAIYGLSFHVDYWNRLGWQDPFSTKQYTDRQRQYDRLLKTQTYTPQLVVNGRHDVIGGQRGRIEQLIKSVQEQPASQFIPVDGSLTRQANQVTVRYQLPAGPYRLNAALVQKEARTNVQRGENGGRTLVNTNVVRQFRTLDQPGQSGSVTLPMPDGLKPDDVTVVLYAQRTDNSQVVGAKRL